MFLFLLSVLISFVLIAFGAYHIYLVLYNLTTIESMAEYNLVIDGVSQPHKKGNIFDLGKK